MSSFPAPGKLTQSQIKCQSFFFDCADPSVNFTDGFYDTNVVLKNNAAITFFMIKYFQNLAAYPAITVEIFTDTGGLTPILNTDVLPFANPVNQYKAGNKVPGPVLGVGYLPAIGDCINNNNVGVIVNLVGITGSGITALSFEACIMYVEFDF